MKYMPLAWFIMAIAWSVFGVINVIFTGESGDHEIECALICAAIFYICSVRNDIGNNNNRNLFV